MKEETEPRKLFELFEHGTLPSIRLSPKQTQEFGKLDTQHTSNFIYIAWMIYIIPVYCQSIHVEENVSGFIFLESHFLISIIVNSVLYKFYTEQFNFKNKPELKYLKFLLSFLCLSVSIDFLRSWPRFYDFISIFHKAHLLQNFSNTYLFFSFILLISYNYYSPISDFSMALVFTLGLCMTTQNFLIVTKFRIFLMYVNLLILIPDTFKFLCKINPSFRYLQILLCVSFNTAIQSHTNSPHLTDYLIIFFVIVTLCYSILYNSCYYLRKERLKGKWDLPFVVNYY